MSKYERRMTPRCPCGKPLHYTNPATKAMVEELIAEKGEEIEVSVGEQRYMVSRHYIALHGLLANAMEALADQGIVKRLGTRSARR